MIVINTLMVSDDRQQLMLDVQTSVGHEITGIKLWTDVTYKDESLDEDLSGLIVGSSEREILNIELSSYDLENYTGFFFLEITSNDDEDECSDCEGNTITGVTLDLTKYHDCLMEKALGTIIGKSNDEALEAQLILDNIYWALRGSWYQEAITFLSYLKEICEDCSNCKELEYRKRKTNLGFGTLNGTMKLQ